MENFDEYLRQGEPNKAEKAKVWKTAIGLQQVDGLKPSDYLIETAKLNIEGDITIDEVKKRIDSYYQQHPTKTDEGRTEEANGFKRLATTYTTWNRLQILVNLQNEKAECNFAKLYSGQVDELYPKVSNRPTPLRKINKKVL